MNNSDEEQTKPNEHWIDGVSPWDRMLAYVKSYNVFPEEQGKRKDEES